MFDFYVLNQKRSGRELDLSLKKKEKERQLMNIRATSMASYVEVELEFQSAIYSIAVSLNVEIVNGCVDNTSLNQKTKLMFLQLEKINKNIFFFIFI